MNNLISLGNHNISLILKGSDITHIFINEEDEAKRLTKELNINKDDAWLYYVLENVQTYGVLKPKFSKNRISVIMEYDKPIVAYINNLYKAEAEFSILSKDLGKDIGTYKIIRMEV